MNSNSQVVHFDGLSKSFGATKALVDVNLEVPCGSIIGLLGANGAGKSTLLRHIIGLYLPSAGQVKTFGRVAKDLGPKEIGRIGYVHQEGALLDWMKVTQLIRYVSAYYPTWNTDLENQYVKEFSIPLDKRVGKLSPGQRQQLAILLAIAFEPELLILDEPASGLDPISRLRFLEILLDIIQEKDRTIIISSHILTDIEKVIDRVLVLNAGRVLRDCSLDDLRQEFCHVQVEALEAPIPQDIFLPYAIDVESEHRKARFTLRSSNLETVRKLAEKLNCSFDSQALSLEESYKTLVTFETREGTFL